MADSSRRGVLLAAGGLPSGALLAGGVLAAAGVAAAAASAAGLGGGGGGGDARQLIQRGMTKFRSNDVEGSVADFDAALAADASLRPYLWQRGLSLYYVGSFQEGAKQFRDDVAVNPNDTEESIWAFLCEAQLEGPAAARANMLQVGRDSRPYMRAAYEAFRDGAGAGAIAAAAGPDPGAGPAFYAWLYVGLYHEAHGDAGAAREAMLRAVGTAYARRSGDYMAALARVHCQRRGWEAA
ncbi:hypothetical protein Rsub_04823 [Raphidocelis subcapitata]|uniref:Uncharacterized protein n=1 Tax=Raphidocelis subcapitata TaxID=307507 RepID=A0A2V0NU37_9CHLO|nr:hypothetical protein Rsub_04823 [Raphidocelis subcapitata]|eukprot:GBF91154.1 hypothetical protein Rsub_04823 [Raphidocelis subcapitata]